MLRICIISGLGWPSPTLSHSLTSPSLSAALRLAGDERKWRHQRLPLAGSVGRQLPRSPLGYIHYIYWDIGGRLGAGGMIRGSYLLTTLSWHSETSNCESKYSLHQENLPIMMGAGHYCDQLSHRSGKWDVINVAVNNNIRIYCGKITTAIEVKLDIKSCRWRHPGQVPSSWSG